MVWEPRKRDKGALRQRGWEVGTILKLKGLSGSSLHLFHPHSHLQERAPFRLPFSLSSRLLPHCPPTPSGAQVVLALPLGQALKAAGVRWVWVLCGFPTL